MSTLGDIADFFNINMSDYPEGNTFYETSNNVTLEFKSTDPDTKAYPCGFRALPIRSSTLIKLIN